MFLDEIAELGLDEQAMLLQAIEEKQFIPLGSDSEVKSNFQLISGTNKDLMVQVEKGLFREDLLARINLWTYPLPSLKQRLEDLQPNIDYELERYAQQSGSLVGFNQTARENYSTFSTSPKALWKANFRDLNASITRMATLAPGGRITESIVADEVQRLKQNWQSQAIHAEVQIDTWLTQPIDRFDRFQLAEVIKVCQQSASAAEAGRVLFDISRENKVSNNDIHRLGQYLKKFGLNFELIKSRHPYNA